METELQENYPDRRTVSLWSLTRTLCCILLVFAASIKLIEPPSQWFGIPLFAIGVVELWIAITAIFLRDRRAWILLVGTFCLFLFVSLFSWMQSKSCRCFGAESHPMIAVVADLVVLAMLGLSRAKWNRACDLKPANLNLFFPICFLGFAIPLVADILRDSTVSAIGRPVLNNQSAVGIAINELFSGHSLEMIKERFTGRVFFLHEGCDRCHRLANQASVKTSSDEVFVVWAHPGEVYTICAGLVTPNVARNIGEHVVWSSDAPTWTGPVCLNFVEGICVRWESLI